jgi:lipopolysaccharide/colanic/teichoic acid biosynthesis glycosyltransferase
VEGAFLRESTKNNMPNNSFYCRLGKRVFDVVGSFLALLLTSPLFLLIAVAIKLSSPGPMLFHQKRVGKNGRLFEILKFRSMRVNAENEGPEMTAAGDARVTPVGAALRRTKLDELPQFWNVLVGDMSFVGPRPRVPNHVAMYSDRHRVLLSIRPGITDPASIQYLREEELLRRQSDPEQYAQLLLNQKLAISLEYVSHMSFRQDVRLVFLTLLACLNRRSKTVDPALEADSQGAWD